MEFLRSAGIVHADLKPEDIMAADHVKSHQKSSTVAWLRYKLCVPCCMHTFDPSDPVVQVSDWPHT